MLTKCTSDTAAVAALRQAQADHSRTFGPFRFVYAVASRRAGGVSIGVNLNPDRACNFQCVYCQVDRSGSAPRDELDLEVLAAELARILDMIRDGSILRGPRFAGLPAAQRRVVDIALAGDGEPTACPDFAAAVDLVIDARRSAQVVPPGLVLITNASRLDAPEVERAIDRLYAAGGEAWVKLDAGAPAAFRRIAQTRMPFERVVAGITRLGRRHPVVIQSLFCRLHDEPVSDREIARYCECLAAIRAAGATIRLVQIYTLARVPAEAHVTALSAPEIDRIADRVAAEVRVPIARFPPI